LALGRGRPAHVRNVHTYEGVLMLDIDEVLLDTSFVAEAHLTSQKGHAEASNALQVLAAHGAVLYFNRLLEAELCEMVFKASLEERWPSRAIRRIRFDGRARRPTYTALQTLLTAWENTLSYFDYVTVDLGEVLDQVPEYMVQYGLSSYDAVHAATAKYVGVKAILTRDVGFANLPEDVALYVDRSRVESCREIRGGRFTRKQRPKVPRDTELR
jgi:predicted nucleic acid-binding protein